MDKREGERECYNVVEQEDEDLQSIVQEILRTRTDFLRRIIVPVEGQGGVTSSYFCPHCHRLPLEDCILVGLFWASKEAAQLVVCGGGQYNWKATKRVLVTQDSTDWREAKVRRMRRMTRRKRRKRKKRKK